jgi:hypothetical protein
MAELFEDVDFPCDTFEICLLLDFVLLEDFDSDLGMEGGNAYLLLSEEMDGQFDFAESALADGLAWMDILSCAYRACSGR